LAQGFSIGGEYSGVMIYLGESAPENRRGFITSFAAVGANMGFLLATLSYIALKLTFDVQTLNNWGWRLPFVLAGLPGAIFLYYRFKLSETQVYAQLQTAKQIEKNPLITALRRAPRQLCKVFGLTCMSASFYYVFFGYMPYYLEQYCGVPLKHALILQCLLLIAMLFLVPLGGLCGDYFTRKKMIVWTTASVVVFSLPCFYLLQRHAPLAIIASVSIAAVLSSLDQGNVLSAIVENFPENVRYSGLALSYNLGNAVFGGTTPFVTSVLVEKGGPLMPGYYLMIMAAISLFTATTLLNNNRVEGILMENA
jgi:MHS family proline/betaine transporter-like MFS transporter